MAKRTPHAGDLPAYRAKRDFTVTSEPQGSTRGAGKAPIFVVQKHDARRLHWDFRLEHGGVLWSWAVPKGPSADTADKRLAVHVEDHPLDYADFEGTIPAGQYGAGTVELWDRGTWAPKGDPEAGLAKGELKFTLAGERLNGGYVLVRLKPRAREKAENWLLIKEHDADEHPGLDATAMEQAVPQRARRASPSKGAAKPPAAKPSAAKPSAAKPSAAKPSAAKPPAAKPPAAKPPADKPPAAGAVKGSVPDDQRPQLATGVEEPPDQGTWLHEIKFDGYRVLLFKAGEQVRIITRNGHDWTNRLPALANDVAHLPVHDAVLDGELIAQREDGVSSFALLQQALSDRKTANLVVFVFDLLQWQGWDLRACRLTDRKALLQGLTDWRGGLRYSDHHPGQGAAMRRQACQMGLEGVIAKQADAPYQAGRSRTWLKLKCQGREEFIVLGWTPPEGSRAGLGSLHMGYHDETGALQYAGGVGTGFTDRELTALRKRLDGLAAPSPPTLLLSDEPPDRSMHWVRPDLVAEVQYTGWSGAGRLRHAVYLGLREDKSAAEVVRPAADPQAARQTWPKPVRTNRIVHAAGPKRLPAAASRVHTAPRIVAHDHGNGHLTHPDRQLWPGITKQDLADYWASVAEVALPEVANRPLALVRCPDGIDGEHFFQKHRTHGFPDAVQEGEAGGAPYLFITGAEGLQACAQMSAIELHGWGARLDDPLHPDRMVFDLDPGDGVAFAQVVDAALDLRQRLGDLKLVSFCRTTGGKGLHLVVPLRPAADWDTVKAFCKSFAETLSKDQPDRFVSTVSKARRQGRILIDWLRNGLGATAVVSFSPRARPGAGVATRLRWDEVTHKLDPAAFNLRSIPERLRRQRADPWQGFDDTGNALPAAERRSPTRRRR
jgi:bifunctional non-homologous end joining protein LigD